jgi:hypothetical protein
MRPVAAVVVLALLPACIGWGRSRTPAYIADGAVMGTGAILHLTLDKQGANRGEGAGGALVLLGAIGLAVTGLIDVASESEEPVDYPAGYLAPVILAGLAGAVGLGMIVQEERELAQVESADTRFGTGIGLLTMFGAGLLGLGIEIVDGARQRD